VLSTRNEVRRTANLRAFKLPTLLGCAVLLGASAVNLLSLDALLFRPWVLLSVFNSLTLIVSRDAHGNLRLGTQSTVSKLAQSTHIYVLEHVKGSKRIKARLCHAIWDADALCAFATAWLRSNAGSPTGPLALPLAMWISYSGFVHLPRRVAQEQCRDAQQGPWLCRWP